MLTDMKIQHLKTEPRNKRYADRDGLVLEIRPSGKKMFLFRFQWVKKPQTMTLGTYPGLSLAKARIIVTEYRALLDQGMDPRVNEDSKAQLTLYAIAEQWYQKNIHRWKPSTQKHHRRSLDRDIYPLLRDKSIHEITKAELLHAIQIHELRGHHEVAHRLHDRLETIFEFALGASLTENYPFIGLKKALAPKPRVTNQPAISPNEAHELLKKVRTSNAGKTNKLYIELLAHLFVRPSELRLARWEEFTLNPPQQAEWNIPVDRMKMAAPHWVPLSPQALELIKELRLLNGFTPYLFNSPTTKIQKPISEASARKLLHQLGYKGKHTLHGFRSISSTVLHEQGGFKIDSIEAQMAHKVQGVRGVYMRADFKAERRELMNWYSSWLQNHNTPFDIHQLRSNHE
jgi:integrase